LLLETFLRKKILIPKHAKGKTKETNQNLKEMKLDVSKKRGTDPPGLRKSPKYTNKRR